MIAWELAGIHSYKILKINSKSKIKRSFQNLAHRVWPCHRWLVQIMRSISNLPNSMQLEQVFKKIRKEKVKQDKLNKRPLFLMLTKLSRWELKTYTPLKEKKKPNGNKWNKTFKTSRMWDTTTTCKKKSRALSAKTRRIFNHHLTSRVLRIKPIFRHSKNLVQPNPKEIYNRIFFNSCSRRIRNSVHKFSNYCNSNCSSNKTSKQEIFWRDLKAKIECKSLVKPTRTTLIGLSIVVRKDHRMFHIISCTTKIYWIRSLL